MKTGAEQNRKETPEGARVLILGASSNPDRYAWKAFEFLRARGYRPVPVHPRLSEIEGIHVHPNLADPLISEKGPIDTVTVYVNPATLEESVDGIIKLHPRRVIMNPGTESSTARQRLEAAGINVREACTLVLLRTEQF